MEIGLIREIRTAEFRVALTPYGVEQLSLAGHSVKVVQGAGEGSGFSDASYLNAGAHICDATSAWDSELVLKVKEPIASEYLYLRQQILFAYLHLAGSDSQLTQQLLKKNTTAIAYETVTDQQAHLPLLAPMSAIAGNMSIVIGNYFLASPQGGSGIQLGHINDQHSGHVVIIGDGVVGQHAARMAIGMGATVELIGLSNQGSPLTDLTLKQIPYYYSSPEVIVDRLKIADLVVGAVLIPGHKSPWVVTHNMVKEMKPNSVIIDVSIDQGGCIETSHITTHKKPVFKKHGVIHYAVTNMPGAYPRTATCALEKATLPYILNLTNYGFFKASKDPYFAQGINTYSGKITHEAVADSLQLKDYYQPYQ
ncbi:MAG: alanine dehydrogenase [Methylococcales bacterium]|jgi:alanine dehydrogenase|nr:alanine dehydrogenase [Methylococcales bacterium]